MTLQLNGTKTISQNSLSCIKKILPITLLPFILLFQVACSDKSDTASIKKSQKVLDSIAQTKKMREERRTQAQAAVNIGYVDQSKIVSNGNDFGIKVLALRQTAKGYMLDFRFHINDLEKAKEIMQRKVKAKLTVEKDNSTLVVPVTYKLGALRQSGNNLLNNKTYFMFFANPGGHVKPGDLVTFELGGFKAEHITVN